ncbi:MAG TPA: M48 family metalloprotease [Candidatus Eremiobacteraceae bacterium]|nr:M48 family metalloprotease [Candidatus Eremiobacteraceae bacterium]
MGPASFFTGPDSLRWRGENRALFLTLLFAPTTAGLVGFALREQITAQQFAFLIVAAMIYVSIARGRLLGTSVRLHERQLPTPYAIATRCARTLGMAVPHVFVREDPYSCVTSVGLEEPYAIVVSSTWLPHLDDDELTFLIGRELGHIAAGHTRITSLFSASGRENPFVSAVFGAWMRRTEYTADRIGLLCCGSIDAAARAIFTCAFRQVSKNVDYTAFRDQRQEVQSDPTFKLGELLGQEPYATNRLRELEVFAISPLFATWRARLDEAAAKPQPALPQPAAAALPREVDKKACANVWLRATAFLLDWVVVSAIVSSGKVVQTSITTSGKPAVVHASDIAASTLQQFVDQWTAAHLPLIEMGLPDVVALLLVFVYSAILVGIVGRTFGMMVLGLRVVRPDYGRVSVGRAIWQYFVAFWSLALVLPLAGFFWRPSVQDRITGTRIVRGVMIR